jgi:uncharacterized protein YpmS
LPLILFVILYIILHRITILDGRNNAENSECVKHTKRTEEEFTKEAEELKNVVEGYITMTSDAMVYKGLDGHFYIIFYSRGIDPK